MPDIEPVSGKQSRLLRRLELSLSAAGVLVCLSLLACLASLTVLNVPRAARIIKGLVL
jgi:hypothetical protein